VTEFCVLHIRSNTCNELPADFLKEGEGVEIFFEDNESSERRASFERLAKKGIFKRDGLPRYHWSYSSDGSIKSFDVYEHVAWIFDQFRPGFLLLQLQDIGFECLLQFYWESNGTGAGPLVTPKVAELLERHNVGLQFGFYMK